MPHADYRTKKHERSLAQLWADADLIVAFVASSVFQLITEPLRHKYPPWTFLDWACRANGVDRRKMMKNKSFSYEEMHQHVSGLGALRNEHTNICK